MSGHDNIPSATVVIPVQPPADAAIPTLHLVLDSLGSSALQLVAGKDQLEHEIHDVVLHGPGEPVTATEDGLLLLTGSRSSQPQTLDTVRAAGAAGYHAVVVKAFGEDLTGLAQAAEEAGVALLTTSDEMAWRHLDALIASSRSPSYAGDSERFASVGLGDLFALANAIASAVGGAITIEDPTGRVIAYSNLPHHEIDEIRRLGILGRQTPDRPTNYEEYQAVLQSDSPVYFQTPSPEYSSRLAVAVRAGTEALGLLWLLTDRPPVVAQAELVLADAAKVTALHLLRARGQRDPERAQRTETLRLLLAGGIAPGTAAARLGVRPEAPGVVLAIAPVDENAEPLVASARIVDIVALYCETWHSSALCAMDGGVVYAFLPTGWAAEPRTRLMKLADDIAATVRRSGRLDVLIGLGPVAPKLADVHASRQMADRVLAVLAARARTGDSNLRVANVDQVRTDVVLRTVADNGGIEQDMLAAPVQAITAYDEAHSTLYAESLLTYLSTFGNAVRAAELLNVHENTLRYRIRRVQDLFDLDLSDGDQMLTTWLQLRLLSLPR